MQKNGNFSATAAPTVRRLWQNLVLRSATCLLLFFCNKNERWTRCWGLGAVAKMSISGFPLDFLVAVTFPLPWHRRREKAKHFTFAKYKIRKNPRGFGIFLQHACAHFFLNPLKSWKQNGPTPGAFSISLPEVNTVISRLFIWNFKEFQYSNSGLNIVK